MLISLKIKHNESCLCLILALKNTKPFFMFTFGFLGDETALSNIPLAELALQVIND